MITSAWVRRLASRALASASRTRAELSAAALRLTCPAAAETAPALGGPAARAHPGWPTATAASSRPTSSIRAARPTRKEPDRPCIPTPRKSHSRRTLPHLLTDCNYPTPYCDTYGTGRVAIIISGDLDLIPARMRA